MTFHFVKFSCYLFLTTIVKILLCMMWFTINMKNFLWEISFVCEVLIECLVRYNLGFFVGLWRHKNFICPRPEQRKQISFACIESTIDDAQQSSTKTFFKTGILTFPLIHIRLCTGRTDTHRRIRTTDFPHFFHPMRQFIYILLNENIWIPIQISRMFVAKCPINIIPSLIPLMACHRPGHRPLSEPMIVSFPTHIFITRPRCVKVNSVPTFIISIRISISRISCTDWSWFWLSHLPDVNWPVPASWGQDAPKSGQIQLDGSEYLMMLIEVINKKNILSAMHVD